MMTKDELCQFVGGQIRRARQEQDLSQADLATQIQRRQASVSDMENGKMEVGFTDLVVLSSVLRKPIAYFFPLYDFDPELTSIFTQLPPLWRAAAFDQLNTLVGLFRRVDHV